MPPLFRSDPEENFNLWMQNCFPDASLAREDAIREWLKPLEACVQRNNNHPAEITAFNGPEMPAAAPKAAGAGDGGHSNETGSRKPNGWLRWNPHLPDSSEDDPLADRFALWLRNHSRALLRCTQFAFVALLILSFLRRMPMNKVASPANASIAATQLSKAEPAATASVLPNRQRSGQSLILPQRR